MGVVPEAHCRFCGKGPMAPWQVQHHYRECDKGGRDFLEKKKAARRAGKSMQKGAAPKSIGRILREVLQEHGASEAFVGYMVARAERTGTMDPNDLQRSLASMKTGIPEERIPIVVRDCLERVQSEQKRAQEEFIRVQPPLSQPPLSTATTPLWPLSTTQPSPGYLGAFGYPGARLVARSRLAARRYQETLLGLAILAISLGINWLNAAAAGGPGWETKLVAGLILVGVGAGLIALRYLTGTNGEEPQG